MTQLFPLPDRDLLFQLFNFIGIFCRVDATEAEGDEHAQPAEIKCDEEKVANVEGSSAGEGGQEAEAVLSRSSRQIQHFSPQHPPAPPPRFDDHKLANRLRWLDGVFGTVQHRNRRSASEGEIEESPEADLVAVEDFLRGQEEDLRNAENRKKRSTKAEHVARFYVYLADEDANAQDAVAFKPNTRVKRQAEQQFSYGVDLADSVDLTASQKLRSNKRNTVDVVSADPTLTTFDTVNAQRNTQTQVDPRTFRSAIVPAIRQSRDQFISTISGLISQQCFVGGTVAEVGTDITKYAYQNEFAGRRLADQLTGGDANDLFANMDKLKFRLKGNEDCYAEDDLDCDPQYPFRKMDATCNNLNNPRWGSASATQNRFVNPSYQDQISQPRSLSVTSNPPDHLVPLPPARQVGTAISKNVERPNKKVTTLFVQWSQFIAHDIVRTPTERIKDPSNPDKTVAPRCCGADASCSANSACFPLVIPDDDRFYSTFRVGCLDFIRSQPMPKPNCQLGPRLPTNVETAFIDASHIYGFSDDVALQLRSKRKGRLRINTSPVVKKQALIMVPGGPDAGACKSPDSERKCTQAGDDRVNQHTGLVAMHSLFLRVHNWIATFLSENRPKASDDSVYLLTRKIVGAILQHITYNEMIPVLVGKSIYENPKNGLKLSKKGYCDCYDENVDASINVEFAASSYRLHTLVSNWLPARDKNGNLFPLYQHFNNPNMFYKEGVLDEILTGMTTDIPETYDPEFSFIMQNQLFKPINQSFGGDLLSTNIQRGRDHGVATYNDVRIFCGLPPFQSFHELESIMPSASIRNLASVYRNVNDIDFYAGAISELPVNQEGILGETAACISTEQFKRLKQGDRFWYENAGQFPGAQLREIRKVSIAALLCQQTPINQVQKRALLQESTSNPLMNCDEILAESIQLEPFLKSKNSRAESPAEKHHGLNHLFSQLLPRF